MPKDMHQSKRKPVKLIALAGLMLFGCDSHHGVVREINIESPIEQKCIISAINIIEGVTNAEQTTVSETESYRHYFYDYEYKTLNVRLSAILSSSNTAKLSHVYLRNHRPPPQYEIDTVRLLMAEVERNLEITCNLSGNVGSVKETCHGVHCPPLPISDAQPNTELQRDAPQAARP